MRERLAGLKQLGKYWPVGLFVAANVVAALLVIKAQSGTESTQATTATRRPTDVSDPRKGKAPDSLDLDAARAAADVPSVMDWSRPPGAPAPKAELQAPPGRSVVERLAMGLFNIRSDANDARDSAERAKRELALGIHPLPPLTSTLGVGAFNLPPIGDPLIPLMPITPSNFVTRDSTRIIEVPQAQATPAYIAELNAKLMASGQPFKVVITEPGAPSAVLGNQSRVVSRPLDGSGSGFLTGLSGLRTPPSDVAAPNSGPTYRPIEGTTLQVVRATPPVAQPTPVLPAAPKPHVDPPAAPKPPEPTPMRIEKTEPTQVLTFRSANVSSRDKAESIAAALRAEGGSASVRPAATGPGFKIYCKYRGRRSESRSLASQLGGAAGVAMYFED